MQRNPVGWFELYVNDMPRARHFYEQTLNVTLTPLEGSGLEIELWAFPGSPDWGGASGALVRMAGVNPGGGGTLVYFSCDDCADTAARAAASGGQIHRPKFAIGPYGFIALVSDTEGNLIGLHSMR